MTAPRRRYEDGLKRAGRPPAISKLAQQANRDAERMRMERAQSAAQPAPVTIKERA